MRHSSVGVLPDWAEPDKYTMTKCYANIFHPNTHLNVARSVAAMKRLRCSKFKLLSARDLAPVGVAFAIHDRRQSALGLRPPEVGTCNGPGTDVNDLLH